jgi:NitT/TauT family transport system substrate-binding protein
LLLSFIVLCVAVTSACTSEDGDQASEKITIAQFGHVFLYLPLYIAERQGFFDDQGLDVTLVSTGGDEKTFAAVASGSAQFGVADPTFVAIARQQGQGGQVVASLVNGVTFWGVTFNEDIEPITSPEGFAGLRIATYTAPSTNYSVMRSILDNAPEGPVSARIVEGAFGSLLSMLKADQADIAMELEPVASIAAADGAQVVYSMVEAFGEFAFTGLAVSDEYLNESPETIQKVVNALQEAINFAYSDVEGALAVAVAEFPEVDPKVLESALKRLLDEGTIPRRLVLSREAWEKAISVRKQNGDLKQGGAYEDNVNMHFAEKAEQTIGGVTDQ